MNSRDALSPGGGIFKPLLAAVAALLSAYLLWKLRSLIVPAAVSGLAAYICRPLIARLEHYRVPRGVAIGLLLLAFVLVALFIAGRIAAMMPTETAAVELKVHSLYRLNESYNRLMGLDPSLSKGNRLYRWVHQEADPIVDRINRHLVLTPEEQSQFLASRPSGLDAPAASDRLLDYHRANLKTLKLRLRAAFPEAGGARPGPLLVSPPEIQTHLAALGHILSAWIIAPLVFLFLLRDTGEIKRGLLRVVPNRLFEPALMILEDMDRALGDYVRGLFLECTLLGLTVALLLAIVGLSPRWAMAIGVFAGLTNVIPYLGSAVAMLGGLAYALLADEIHPILPMVNPDNFALWVIAAVGLAEVLKNLFYEPFVLGGAVKIHPLGVILGVVGGGILFDLAGVLLAIPAITVFKVFVSSTARQLKAYGFI